MNVQGLPGRGRGGLCPMLGGPTHVQGPPGVLLCWACCAAAKGRRHATPGHGDPGRRHPAATCSRQGPMGTRAHPMAALDSPSDKQWRPWTLVPGTAAHRRAALHPCGQSVCNSGCDAWYPSVPQGHGLRLLLQRPAVRRPWTCLAAGASPPPRRRQAAAWTPLDPRTGPMMGPCRGVVSLIMGEL